jgi:hypothetical protein
MAARGIYNVMYIGPLVYFVVKDNANYQFPRAANGYEYLSIPLVSPITDSCGTPAKNSYCKKKVLHSNGQETFCWSSNYVTSTQSSVLYCSKEQFIQNWVR